MTEAAALHADDELFAKHIEPEPEDPVDWAMAEASDDKDDAPMPDAPQEPELIDLPPAPASAPPMSNLLKRCNACASCTAPDHDEPRQNCHHHHISFSLLSHVSVVPCVLVRTLVSMS